MLRRYQSNMKFSKRDLILESMDNALLHSSLVNFLIKLI